MLISEVYVNPSQNTETANEWIELYNAGNQAVELADWTLSDNMVAVKLPASVIAPSSYLMVVADVEEFRGSYPSFGGTVMQSPARRIGNGLSNGADMVVLRGPSGRLEDSVNWGRPQTTWPNYHTSLWDPGLSPPSSGHSLVRTAGQDAAVFAVAWTSSFEPSPGEPAPFVAPTPTPPVTSTPTRAPTRTAIPTAVPTRTPTPIVLGSPEASVPPAASVTPIVRPSVGPAPVTDLSTGPWPFSSTFTPAAPSPGLRTTAPITAAPTYLQASTPAVPTAGAVTPPFIPLTSAREPQREQQAPTQKPELKPSPGQPEDENPSIPQDLVPLLFVGGPSLGLVLYLRRCFFS